MAPTSGNPKVWKKEPTPYHPESACAHPSEEEAERLPYGLPVHEGPEAVGSTSGEEEEERDLPLPKDLDTARFEDIREERCTWATTPPRISSLKRASVEPGVTVRTLC